MACAYLCSAEWRNFRNSVIKNQKSDATTSKPIHTEMSSRACCSAYFGSLVNKTMPKQTYHSNYFSQGDKRIQDDDSDKIDIRSFKGIKNSHLQFNLKLHFNGGFFVSLNFF